MEERRFRIGSLLEWTAAAFGVMALLWVISVPVQRLLGPRVEAAIVNESHAVVPSGVPASALKVPLVLLLDGREIRQGDREKIERHRD